MTCKIITLNIIFQFMCNLSLSNSYFTALYHFVFPFLVNAKLIKSLRILQLILYTQLRSACSLVFILFLVQRSWYFALFLSFVSSMLSLQATVNSSVIICFVEWKNRSMSGHKMVYYVIGEFQLTFQIHPHLPLYRWWKHTGYFYLFMCFSLRP